MTQSLKSSSSQIDSKPWFGESESRPESSFRPRSNLGPRCEEGFELESLLPYYFNCPGSILMSFGERELSPSFYKLLVPLD